MAKTKYNSYKQDLVAKKFPRFNSHVLDKITVKNGFTLKEVREYKSKLRAIAIDSLDEHKLKCYFGDASSISGAFIWGETEEGIFYWNDLKIRLDNLENIPTLSNPVSNPVSQVFSIQGKDKLL